MALSSALSAVILASFIGFPFVIQRSIWDHQVRGQAHPSGENCSSRDDNSMSIARAIVLDFRRMHDLFSPSALLLKYQLRLLTEVVSVNLITTIIRPSRGISAFCGRLSLIAAGDSHGERRGFALGRKPGTGDWAIPTRGMYQYQNLQ
jgi:hypothetical protein